MTPKLSPTITHHVSRYYQKKRVNRRIQKHKQHSIYVDSFTPEEFSKDIKSSTNTSAALDLAISNHNLGRKATQYLKDLLNLSLQTQVIATVWKLECIVPIKHQGNPYRPKSLLRNLGTFSLPRQPPALLQQTI